jgi:hypothetical protein
VGASVTVERIETLLDWPRKVLLASLAVLPPLALIAQTWILFSPCPADGSERGATKKDYATYLLLLFVVFQNIFNFCRKGVETKTL